MAHFRSSSTCKCWRATTTSGGNIFVWFQMIVVIIFECCFQSVHAFHLSKRTSDIFSHPIHTNPQSVAIRSSLLSAIINNHQEEENENNKNQSESNLLQQQQQRRRPPPSIIAYLTGYISNDEDRLLYEAALRRQGFIVIGETPPPPPNSSDDNHDNKHCSVCYRFHAASGMLQLVSSSSSSSSSPAPNNNNLNIPRWISIFQDKESVLVSNGWSFLDPDTSDPLSAFDVDAANQEGLYQPKWGRKQEDNNNNNNADTKTWKVSQLGFLLEPNLSAQEIQQEAESVLVLTNEQSKRTLLQGATDPPHVKTTNNGYDFSGSLQHQRTTTRMNGIWTCAIGGLPLFTTADLSPTTASSGWLSFSRPISEDHVCLIHPANDTSDQRIEVVCAKTGCHLGHYFGREEGYCINASALIYHSTTTSNNENSQNHNIAVRLDRIHSYRAYERRQLSKEGTTPSMKILKKVLDQSPVPTETILLGAGCFWHIEFALRRLPGVVQTKVGYAGGSSSTTTVENNNNPTYEQVCKGNTGHAEVVMVEYDPNVLNLSIFLDCFLALHNPTKVRAHGKHAEYVGQYRSCIFVADADAEHVAQQALEQCQRQLGKELSTQIIMCLESSSASASSAASASSTTATTTTATTTPSLSSLWTGVFWEAEDRHQRHDERRLLRESGAKKKDYYYYDDDDKYLSTLSLVDWLFFYGKRSESIKGSAQTLNTAAAVDHDLDDHDEEDEAIETMRLSI